MKKKLKKYLPVLMGKYLQFRYFFNKRKTLHKTYLLFSTPRKGKILPDQEYFLEEAEDELVPFNNLYIQTYRWPSNGETVLLVHGWESNAYRWKTLIEKLQHQNYNVIAFDAPGHGHSSGKILNVPLYADCLQKIIELYRPNHIIGHSVGGMTTMYHEYKFSNPELEKHVVLAPPTELSSIMNGFQNTLRLSDKFMEALSTYFKEKFDFYFEEFSMAEFAKSIHKKGLLIHDKYDDIAPYEDVTSIAKNWKGLQFMTTEHFGHSLFFDEVDDRILAFLK